LQRCNYPQQRPTTTQKHISSPLGRNPVDSGVSGLVHGVPDRD